MAAHSWWFVAQADAPAPLLPDASGVGTFWLVLIAVAVLLAALLWWVVRSVRAARRAADQASADVAELRAEVQGHRQ